MKALQVIPNKTDKSILLSLEKPFFSLIWLHGLGDSSAGFLDYFKLKASPLFRGARVKLLQSPVRCVTINNGIPFNSWYDIKSLAGTGKEEDRYNMEEVKDSMNIIDKHILEEINFWKTNGIKDSDEQICKRIFIGGFSQGCAMSLCYGLNADRLIAGVVGFSGHLFETLSMKNKSKLPMIVFHGNEDDVLQYKWVKGSYDKHLKQLPNFRFKLIPNLQHSVTEGQLVQSTEWMLKLLSQNNIKA